MITTKDGLLYRDGVMLGVGEADRLAQSHFHPGSTAHYMHCEQLVRDLEKDPSVLMVAHIDILREALAEARDALAMVLANGSVSRCPMAINLANAAMRIES